MRHRLVALAATSAIVVATALPALAYWPTIAQTAMGMDAATMAPPTATFESTTSDVTLTVSAPATGPTPATYVVTYADGDGTHDVCALTEPGQCTDHVSQAATARTYTASSRLGDHWVSSIAVTAATRPPAPILSRSGDAIVEVSAPAGGAAYTVTVHLDGDADPLATLDIPAGSPIVRPITIPVSPVEGHSLTAVSTFLGMNSTVASLSLSDAPKHQPDNGGTPSGTAPADRSDKDRPHVTGVVLANGDGSAGRADEGDTVTLTFDRAIDPASICKEWEAEPSGENRPTTKVTAKLAPDADGNALLTVTPRSGACRAGPDNAVHLGEVKVSGEYLTAEAAKFTGSRLAISDDGLTVTLTLGRARDGDTLGDSVPASAPTFVPADPGPSDASGNSVGPTPKTGDPSRF